MKFDNIEEIAANSFRDFHCKGLDYVCLLRRPQLTLKAYFFEGDVSRAPEAVVPHDHRYDFYTTVLCGSVMNREFRESSVGEVYQRFSYETPLNGGDGFAWECETRLQHLGTKTFVPSTGYFSEAAGLHTISIADPLTVLLLAQFEDKVDGPTSAFRAGDGRQEPSLDGLYSKPDEDYVKRRLRQLRGLGI